MGVPRRSLADRFWARVDKSGECWVWTGCDNGAGYGAINLGGRHGRIERAHRVSWLLHFGSIPVDLCVCHHCDNRRCVRPDHLFLGDRAANNRDMQQKGRYDRVKRPRGPRHGMSRLSEAQVRRIREDHAGPGAPPLRVTAERFGVSLQQVHRIVHRKNWRHA